MRSGRSSATAQNIALARSHLNASTGIVSDPWAVALLDRRRRVVARGLRLPKLRDVVSQRVFAHIAARTLAHDEMLTNAMNAGIKQVVVVAAGFDSRALRLARAGVTFYEVDHPATQAEKRRRLARVGATSDRVRFVPVDLDERTCSQPLISAGLDPQEPSAFVVEGLTMYLSQDANLVLLRDLAGVAAPRSVLGIDFASPATPPPGALGVAARILERTSKLMLARADERVVLLCDADAAATTVQHGGWNLQRVRSARHLWDEYLRDNGWPAPRPGNDTPIIVEGSMP